MCATNRGWMSGVCFVMRSDVVDGRSLPGVRMAVSGRQLAR